MRNGEVIERILKYHPSVERYQGCDGYKAGDPQEECRGIVTALVPTIEVIKKTADMGASLLIVHEPTSHMTPDYPEWRADFANTVYEEKRKLLEENHITVWRDHDHMHLHRPDGIFAGVIKYLEWESCRKDSACELPFYYLFEFPELTVKEMQQMLIRKLGLNGLRYVGNPDSRVRRAAIVAHLFPGAAGPEGEDERGFYHDYSTELIREMEREDGPDVIIPGEMIEWNVVSYIRDAVQLGRNKACFPVGHFNLEELGMRYAADWIGEITEGKVPVRYVPSGDMYHF